ncbi:MAG: hypothetical protein E7354_04690 [Clostridiales bacterium]|nr:hypothetical protein [Clostridiales bacterium]
MGIINYLRQKKKEKLPLIARVDLAELQRQREENSQLGDVSILAKADYTKRIPTIRLYYTALERFNRYGTEEPKVGQTFGISSPFRLPTEMSIEDACKVVSYLSEQVEQNNDIEPASEQSVAMVSNILSQYGFERVESKEKGHYHTVSDYLPFRKIRTDSIPVCEAIEGVTDLFTVGGDFKLFKKTDLHDRYFDWFTAGITKQDIETIYKNIRRDHLLPDDFSNDKTSC